MHQNAVADLSLRKKQHDLYWGGVVGGRCRQITRTKNTPPVTSAQKAKKKKKWLVLGWRPSD